MSKRPRKRDQGMFEGLQDVPSLEDSSDAIFGNPFPVTPTIKVKFVDIGSIYPDPVQPRRAIPSELRERWNIHENSYEDLIVLWLSYMGPDFDLDTYLLDGETERSQSNQKGQPLLPEFEPTDAIQASFIRLLELASSILREGLTNPITISRVGREYMIETGERRWLAYHLLNIYFEDSNEQDWSKIPARIMLERSVWRQATENNVRQNLNAVSRARQLAILLMDIHGWENFRPITDFANEQDFYAQVSDGHEWRIPRGKTEQLLKTMGLNNQTQLRQYRTILRVNPILWQIADDNDWTENSIREASRLSSETLVKQLQIDKSVTAVTESDKLQIDKSVTAVTESDKLQIDKSVTAVTESDKRSSVDQALTKMHKYRKTIEMQAKKSQKGDRLKWLEFAKEQIQWWEQLAEQLADDA